MRPSGFVSLTQLLALPLFQSFSEQQVEQVVQTDAKKRFSMTTTEFEVDEVFIRANQGHTLQLVQDEELLRPLEEPRDVEMCVHGTYLKFWDSIWNSGLSKMQRNHIHFAETDVLDDDAIVSGIRANCNLFVYIDFAMAVKEGIKFYKSSNNVVLSPGGKDTGVIDRRYFLRAVKRDGTVVYEREESVERSE
uniref:2'-phosphotransferase n=1 Tax=Hyaloperonospora arabidopsidis (strain Emoy2) TaxID=559515 RepID=M4B2Z5_HYAAE